MVLPVRRDSNGDVANVRAQQTGQVGAELRLKVGAELRGTAFQKHTRDGV